MLFIGGSCNVLRLGLVAGIVLASGTSGSRAEDPIQPPPYEVAGANGIGVTVVWDAAAIRKALPPGIKPVEGMTGGINIYSTERGYVIGPYSAAYFYVDIEGFDSPEGLKGRWMLAGVYGPQAKTSAALKTYFPIRPGTSRIESTSDSKRAVGTVNGQDFVTAEFKPVPRSCQSGAVLLNYVSQSAETKQFRVVKIPFVGDFCKAELVSAKVTAPSNDPFSEFPIAKVTGVSELRNGSFVFSYPVAAKE